MNAADTMLAFLDRDFHILAVTPTYAKACRRPARNLVGIDFFTLAPKPLVRRLFLRVRATGRPVFRRGRTHTYPGTPRTDTTCWDWSLTPARDQAGRVVGFIHTLRETTRYWRAEQKARQSEERLRMALRVAGMVTWEWDLTKGTIRYSDNAPDLAKGATLDPFMSIEALTESVHPDDRPRLSLAVQKTLEHGEPYECEYRVRMLDGNYYWILGRGGIVVRRRGRPVRIVGISQDITLRKKADVDLKLRSRQLAQLASELTMVEQRERRRLADVLHEQLQQLLFAAKMNADALRARLEQRGGDELEALRRTLDEAMASARSITRDLTPPVPVQRDLPTAFQWMALDMRDRHWLKVDVRVGPERFPITEAMSVLLFTAARELLMNVVKHAGTRRAELRVAWRPKWVVLEVRDRGRGMRPGVLEAPLNHRGFGLFSIRERAELLGGTMTVRSAPRRGTCVTLRLPVPPGEAV